ncbi:hypothetical protein C8Q72DRAFT_775568 [Fomitopsis betulina]|nr:hypothetical protein C8Q72DRAFT_775568 [Fomitopsis betulina]
MALANPNAITPGQSVSHAQAALGAGQPIAFACHSYIKLAEDAGCVCPVDLTGDKNGVLINVYPGFQCAYASGGVCTYNQSGALQTTGRTDCNTEAAPCSTEDSCECPNDLKGNIGILINHFLGYQCAYVHGACTWSYDGTLQNTAQNNCPIDASCTQLASNA